MRLRWYWLAVVVALPLAAAPANGQIVWNITFQDVQLNTGVGFADPVFGALRRDTVTQVTNYVNTVLAARGRVDIEMLPSLTTGTGAVAGMGTFFPTAPNQFTNGALFEHATTGIDPIPNGPDAQGQFNFGYTWNSGTGPPAANQHDLFTVTLHELTHALGFGSLLNANGTSFISQGNPGVFTRYDSFVARGDGRRLFAGGNTGQFVGTPADLTSNDVFFDGSRRVKLFAPGNYAPGSSIGHLDGSLIGVMNASGPPGISRRSYADFEVAILQDIGWTIVPEPGSLLLTGAGSLGLVIALRRRGKALTPLKTPGA
jgi:hypothetical protein